MTLNEIMVSALQRLGRGSDPQTVETYRTVFADYANEAVKQIANQFNEIRKETVELTDKTFKLSQLSHVSKRIDKVEVNGRPVWYWQEATGSGEFKVHLRTNERSETCDVYYRSVPATLMNTIDVPEVPEYTHYLIVHWLVAMERAGGDPNMQGTSSIDFQLFNQGLREIVNSHYGEPDGNKLKGYWH